ncbi:MAG TPA: PHP domain-containing protein [candidate division Zixibacteria bacterium]|nr:PHP domain-containing protein [candidate division Zixibacteria bacterium]
MTDSNQNQPFIDLHLHTTASDGTFTPSEVVRFSKRLNLEAIAITDHDSIAGINEALEAGKREGIEVIPGIEFSTEVKNVSIHIVGLFVDIKSEKLIKLTQEIQNAREKRAKKIIEKINALNKGPIISFEEVYAKANGLIGRPHIAEVLIEKGFASTIEETFENYLKRGASCYVPRFKITPIECFKLLNEMGAIPILAHPGLLPKKLDFEYFLKTLVENGLVGIEVFYPTHKYEQREYFHEIAGKYNLLESGGSDCHGLLNNGPFIGSQQIPYSILDKMKKSFNKD